MGGNQISLVSGQVQKTNDEREKIFISKMKCCLSGNEQYLKYGQVVNTISRLLKT